MESSLLCLGGTAIARAPLGDGWMQGVGRRAVGKGVVSTRMAVVAQNPDVSNVIALTKSVG